MEQGPAGQAGDKIGKIVQEMVSHLIKDKGQEESGFVVAGVLIDLGDLRAFLVRQHGPIIENLTDEAILDLMGENARLFEKGIRSVVYSIVAASIRVDHSGN